MLKQQKKGKRWIKRRWKRFDGSLFFWHRKWRRVCFKNQRRASLIKKEFPCTKRSFYWLRSNRYLRTLKYLLGTKKQSAWQNRVKQYFKKKITFKNFFRQFYGKMSNHHFFQKLKYGLNTANPTQSLMNKLEKQLIKILCRTGITPSLTSARLMVKQGFINVNHKVITDINCEIKIGDLVSINPVIFYNWKFINWPWLKKIYSLKYVEIDHETGSCILLRNPTFKDLKSSYLVRPLFFKTLTQYYR